MPPKKAVKAASKAPAKTPEKAPEKAPEKEKEKEPEEEKEKEKEVKVDVLRNKKEEDAIDMFKDCKRYHIETNSYSLVLRWRTLSEMEMAGLAISLQKSIYNIDSLDIGQTHFDALGMLSLSNIFMTNKTIINLDLGHNDIGELGAERLGMALKRNAALEYINLEWCNIGSEGLKSIVDALKENKQSKVSCLDVHNNNITSDGAEALAEYLATNPRQFVECCIRFNPIGDSGASAIVQALKKNTHIESLDFSRCDVTDDTLKVLAQTIKDINGGSTSGSSTAANAVVGGKRAIESIVFATNDISPVGLELFSTALLEGVSSFKPIMISLYDNKYIAQKEAKPCITGIKALGALLASPLATLTRLDFGGCTLEDEGVVSLSDFLQTSPTLTHLSLEKNKLTSLSSRALCNALVTNKKLQELDLHTNLFNDEAVTDFIKLLVKNKSLTEVDLRFNQKITRGFSLENYITSVFPEEEAKPLFTRAKKVLLLRESRNSMAAGAAGNTMFDAAPTAVVKRRTKQIMDFESIQNAIREKNMAQQPLPSAPGAKK